MIRTGGVAMLVQGLNELPINVPVTNDLIDMCGSEKRQFDLNDICMESLSNTLEHISLLQSGRQEIQATKGINAVVGLFKKT